MSLPNSNNTTTTTTQQHTSLIQQFMTFLKTFGVIGLAIAFVIGQASTALVSSIVTDIITPFLDLFIPNGSLASLSIKIVSWSGQTSEFKYGDLILQLIDFVIIAFIVFLAYKELSKYKIVDDKTVIKT